MSTLTPLQCQNCSAQLDPANPGTHTLRCKYCGSSYKLETAGNTDDALTTAQLKPQTELRAIKPDHLTIIKKPASITITRTWRKKGSFILLAMSITWLAIILNRIMQSLLEGADASILFLLVFVGVGGLLLYRALSELFNQSALTVNKRSVTLVTKPLSWKGDFTQPLNKIKHFEIVPPPGPTLSPSTRVFRLCAITDDDMRLTLMHNISNPGHAIYLLRQINQLANTA